MEKAQAKAKAEIARRSNVRKAKQQTDAEWKAEISRKLDGLSELRKDIWRIAVALEKLAGMKSKDSNKEQISWLESKRDKTKVQGSKRKGKQKEERIDRAEKEKETGGQEEENGMESVEEKSSSFSLVAFSVGMGIL